MTTCATMEPAPYTQFRQPPIPADAELALVRRAQSGDMAARDELCLGKQWIVCTVAGHFRNRGLELDDLIGFGQFGLFRAIDKFDESRGARFSTMAVPWVRQSIRSAVVNYGHAIRVPSHTYDLLAKWRKAERRLGEGCRNPHASDVAVSLGIKPGKAELVAAAACVLSATSSIGGEAADYLDPVSAEVDPLDAMVARDDHVRLLQAMSHLSELTVRVLRLRYGLDGGGGMGTIAVGRAMGLRADTVRMIERDGIREVRARMGVDAGEGGEE